MGSTFSENVFHIISKYAVVKPRYETSNEAERIIECDTNITLSYKVVLNLCQYRKSYSNEFALRRLAEALPKSVLNKRTTVGAVWTVPLMCSTGVAEFDRGNVRGFVATALESGKVDVFDDSLLPGILRQQSIMPHLSVLLPAYERCCSVKRMATLFARGGPFENAQWSPALSAIWRHLRRRTNEAERLQKHYRTVVLNT